MIINVLVDTKETEALMERIRQRVPQLGTSLVSDISAGARRVANTKFFNRPYSEDTHSSLNILNRFGVRIYKDKNGRRTVRRGPAFTIMSKAGRIDRLGRRMVNFKLDTKQPFVKIAHFTAYPLNLYENDVINRGKKRPGTHIMLQKLPPAIQGTIAQSVTKMDQRIEREFGGSA